MWKGKIVFGIGEKDEKLDIWMLGKGRGNNLTLLTSFRGSVYSGIPVKERIASPKLKFFFRILREFEFR